jgi:hypothetical protein
MVSFIDFDLLEARVDHYFFFTNGLRGFLLLVHNVAVYKQFENQTLGIIGVTTASQRAP